MAKNNNDRAIIDLVINGQQSKASLKEISVEATRTRSALLKMKEADDPAAYQQKLKDYRALTAAQKEMTGRINESTTAWGRFKSNMTSTMTGVLGGNLLTTGLQTLIGLVPAAISSGMKLRDQFADIAKATDMSAQEVKDLNEQLKGFNTRTPTEELRQMAVVAGQFGIAKNDIAGFVKSADMLNVALGDQFNSAEETASIMLTLRNTFQDIKSDHIDQDMLHIGNAINYLESQGAATGAVMADFASRIGGVAIPMGMTSAQVLGISAALQEMNVTAERGSTAVVDILNGMAKAPASFSKYAYSVDGAKLSQQEFIKLVNTDMMGALLSVVRGFKQGDTSATGMAKKLDDLDLKGNGVMEIFMKLASNTELVQTRVDQASSSISNASSITAEFSKKNHDLAINMKRLSEWFANILQSDGIQGFVGFLVEAAAGMLGLNNATADATKTFEDQKNKVADLDKNLKPLLDRHDVLKQKTVLTKDEQAELKNIVGQVANIVPSAVTEFDKYGNALGVNTQKAREFIKMQQELLKYNNKVAIGETDQKLADLKRKQAETAAKLNSGNTSERDPASFGGGYRNRAMTEDERTQLRAELDKLKKEIEKADALKAALTGSYLNTSETKPATGGKPAAVKYGETADAEEEKKKQAHNKKLADDKVKANQAADLAIQRLEEQSESNRRQRELEKAEYEANQERERMRVSTADAAKKATWAKAIDDKLAADKIAINKKYDEDEQKKEVERLNDLRLVAAEELRITHDLEVAKIRERVAAGGLTSEQGKQAELLSEQAYLQAKELLYGQHYEAIANAAWGNQDLMKTVARQIVKDSADVESEKTKNLGDQASARADIRKAELEHQEEMSRRSRRSAQEEAEFRQRMLNQTFSMMQNDWAGTLEGYKNYWQNATRLQKAGLVAEKAYALALIGINLQKQLSTISVMSAAMNAVIPGSGTAMMIAGYAKAISSAAVQVAGVIAAVSAGSSAPAFAEGGFTGSGDGPAGYVDGPTLFTMGRRRFVAGEAGREFVISNKALQNPVVADFARMMDAAQKTGNYSQLQSMDGMTSSAFGIGSDTKQAVGMSQEVGLAILQELRMGRAASEQKSSQNVALNYRLFEQYRDNLESARIENSL